tara:strand:- start:115 stop:558 length:444 start_codon:yes stop_codon:yes gene_type:complete
MRMIDIGQKKVTERKATVEAVVKTKAKVIELIKKGKVPKGNVIEAAKLSAIMAAKKTPDILALCHPIAIETVEVDFKIQKDSIKISTFVKGDTKTGVEMEAFTAASVAALTVYDMCKSLDRGMTINQIRLMKKSGGKSGTYTRLRNK